MKKIVIIGGGFCGTMAAVNLARLSESPLEVTIVNTKHPPGRGVAYGTNRREHLLNVAARNMSAVPDHPDHFVAWLRTRAEYREFPELQLRETYAPRQVFGDYLCSLLLNYARPIDDHHPTTIDVVSSEAVDLEVRDDGRITVSLEENESLLADHVLLATGNQQPAPLPGADLDHPAYHSDPWSDWYRRLPPDGEIVIIGSGLTMVDVFLTLTEMKWPGQITVVSRNGMVPQAHFRGIEYPDFLPKDAENMGLAKLSSLLEEHCAHLRSIGENPGIIVDRLRPLTQRIWHAFSLDEKREFLANHAARWNVIRHRIAQPIHQLLTESITGGNVQVRRGRATQVVAVGDKLQVTLSTADGGYECVEGATVINCTGPNAGFSESPVPLFQNLMQRGLIQPDPLDMGIEVAEDFLAINDAGERVPNLYVIGPLMKGTLWETTAVPELRGQAMRVAQCLIDTNRTVPSEHDYRLSLDEEHVIEYYI